MEKQRDAALAEIAAARRGQAAAEEKLHRLLSSEAKAQKRTQAPRAHAVSKNQRWLHPGNSASEVAA